MLDLNAARDKLAALATAAAPANMQVTVYRSGLRPLADFPAVVIRQPSWTPSGELGLSYRMDRWRWPISVVLEKPGTQDPVTVDVLDQLWTALLAALQDQVETDPGWAGLCRQTMVDHAEFGTFTVQGQEYPAQTIYVDLHA